MSAHPIPQMDSYLNNDSPIPQMDFYLNNDSNFNSLMASTNNLPENQQPDSNFNSLMASTNGLPENQQPDSNFNSLMTSTNNLPESQQELNQQPDSNFNSLMASTNGLPENQQQNPQIPLKSNETPSGQNQKNYEICKPEDRAKYVYSQRVTTPPSKQNWFLRPINWGRL
ncbi:hypothetical protein G9A89_011213 [Geosiphon pyriformis]|nr:hypothetical protein G9A89_011213 [Geosiphon pyriformis]